jgi:peroxiredoxin
MRIITFILFMIAMQPAIWAADPVKKNYPSEGELAPNFSFELEKAKPQLFSEYNNKIVYLVFFATWCPPCRAELPHVQKEIWEKYSTNEQFKLLVVGREHTREELDKFVRENNFTFPVVPDPKREIFSLFAPQEIPRSYLIDQNGRIVKIMVGFDAAEFEKMKKLIETELNKERLNH